MLALQRGFAASKPHFYVITHQLQLKVFKHGLSLLKNIPGKSPRDPQSALAAW